MHVMNAGWYIWHIGHVHPLAFLIVVSYGEGNTEAAISSANHV